VLEIDDATKSCPATLTLISDVVKAFASVEVASSINFLRDIPSVFFEDLTVNLARFRFESLTRTDSLGVTADSDIVTDQASTILILPATSLANHAVFPSLSSHLIRTVGVYVACAAFTLASTLTETFSPFLTKTFVNDSPLNVEATLTF
jgi:hypothetical protein